MKILHLIKNMGIGGAEKICFELARNSSSIIEQVYIASPRGLYADHFKKNNIEHLTINEFAAYNKFLYPFLFLIIRKIIHSSDFDILHAHHRILAFFAQKLKSPDQKLIYTAHNVFCDRFQNYLKPDIAIGVSNYVYKNLIETTSIHPPKIITIENGVGITEQNKTSYEFNRPLSFGFVGRFIRAKGIFLILNAARMLRDTNIDFSITFRGQGESEAEIRKLISKYELKNNVIIKEPVLDTGLIYDDIDVLLLPTFYEEGLSLSIIEAMSQNKIVIASNIAQNKEIIENGKDGFLIDLDEQNSLYNTMKYVLLNREGLTRIAETAGNKIKCKYSLDRMLAAYNKLYNSILRENNNNI